MRILVTTYGTDGDTRPMAALSGGLIEAGHEVTLLGDASGDALARDVGVPYAPLAGDIRDAVSKLLSKGASGNPGRAARSIATLATDHTTAWMKTMLDHAAGCDAIVFSGLTSYAALSVAEHCRIPAIAAGLQPAAPTRAFPSPFLPPIRVPGFCNAMTHRLIMGVFWRMFRGPVNAARKATTGQPPRRRMWRDYPALLGLSPQLVPRPDDWPDYIVITGDWPLPGAEWTPSKELADFLDAGDRPVYAGFGSMVGFDRSRTVETLAAALQGRRVLLSGGWSGLGRANLPPNMMAIGAVPHDRLFPHVAAAIHHGGAGTSHTASRAGIPSVVIPFAGDQFFWASQLARAGVAPSPIPHGQLNAASLRRRVEEASAEGMRERAREVGRLMRAERGVETAVGEIERFLRTGKGEIADAETISARR